MNGNVQCCFFIPKSISIGQYHYNQEQQVDYYYFYVLIILTIANFHLKLTHFKAFTGVCLLIFVCFIVSTVEQSGF